MNFLITAGATREYIDPVRFISNPSSGRMGIAVAQAAKKRGHNVVLVMGHCTVEAPREIPMVMAATALEMRRAVLQYAEWADVLVMAAAVGDWRAKRQNRHKIKKKGQTLTLKLIANPDILTEIGRLKRRGMNVFLVGFSVDTDSLLENANKKLKAKNLDLIVTNPQDTFGSTAVKAAMIDKHGKITRLPLLSKERLAGKLVRLIEKSIQVK